MPDGQAEAGVPAQCGEGDLIAADVTHREKHAAVVPRPFESSGPYVAAGVDLHPVELILRPPVTRRWGRDAGIAVLRRRLFSSRHEGNCLGGLANPYLTDRLRGAVAGEPCGRVGDRDSPQHLPDHLAPR